MSPAAVVLNADKHEGLSEELTASDIPTVCVTGSHPGASKIMRNGTSNEPQPFSPLLLLNAVEGVITSRDHRPVPLISVPAL